MIMYVFPAAVRYIENITLKPSHSVITPATNFTYLHVTMTKYIRIVTFNLMI